LECHDFLNRETEMVGDDFVVNPDAREVEKLVNRMPALVRDCPGSCLFLK
jgi:hypothetical protein